MSYQTPGTPVPPPPHPSQTHSNTRTLNGLIAALAVVDAILIIIAVVLGMNVFSSDGAPESPQSSSSQKSASTGTDPSDEDDSSAPGASTDLDAEDLPDIKEVTGAESFATPTGNIMCTISSTGVHCSIAKLNKAPSEDDACDGYIGYVVELRATGTTLPCIPKAELPGAAGSGQDVLDYGKKKTVNNFTCESLKTGMKCEDTNSGRGFSLARAGISTF